MRALIEHKIETTGFFKKHTTYWVHLRIEYTPEETQIIKARGLWHAQILNIPRNLKFFDGTPYGPLTCTFLQAKNGWRRGCSTPVDAKEFEEQLKTNYLPIAKSWLDSNKTTNDPTVIEL